MIPEPLNREASSTTLTQQPAPKAVTSCTGVVIPVRNRPTLVCEAITSVLAQTQRPAKLIIVDDGSNDHTVQAINDLLKNTPFSSATCLPQAQCGATVAKNTGLEACTQCEFIAFLDSDDLWPPDFLERAETMLQQNKQAVAVSTNRQLWDLSTGIRNTHDLSALAQNPIHWFYRNGSGVGSCTLFRADSVRQAGYYPIDYPTGHDILLFARIALLGEWLHTLGQEVIFRRNHSDTYGEMPHIKDAYPNYALLWTNIFEELTAELASTGHLDTFIRKQMGRRWRRSAEQLMELKDCKKARSCLRKALQYNLFSVRTWRSIIRTLPGACT